MYSTALSLRKFETKNSRYNCDVFRQIVSLFYRMLQRGCELPLAYTTCIQLRRCTRLCSLARYPSSDRKDCAFGIRHSAHVCMSSRRMCIRMQNPSWWHANVCGVSNSECTILSSDPKDCAFGIRHSAHIWMLSRRMCIRMQNPSWRRADVCGVSNSECTILQIGASWER